MDEKLSQAVNLDIFSRKLERIILLAELMNTEIDTDKIDTALYILVDEIAELSDYYNEIKPFFEKMA